MENQHRKISGYRELTQQEIDLMNKIKSIGPQLSELCKEVTAHLAIQTGDAFDSDINFEPFYWAENGKRQLQMGLMYLTRAIAQPDSF